MSPVGRNSAAYSAECKPLLPQEGFRLDVGLLEDGAQRAFRHIAGMIGDGGVTVGLRIEPNLMGARRLTVELEAELTQALDDLPVLEARQPPHLAAHPPQALTTRG